MKNSLVLPAIPIGLESLIRGFIFSDQNWYVYINSGSLIITFSIWCMLTLTDTPAKPLIPTDESYAQKISNVRFHLGTCSIIGLVIFGVNSMADALSIQYKSESTDMTSKIGAMCALFALGYSAYTVIIIFIKRREIGVVNYV